MAELPMEEDEVYTILELPSSQLGPNYEDFSDDGGWISDAEIEDRAILDSTAQISNIDISGNESDSSNTSCNIDDPSPSTSKRSKITVQKNSKTPKKKIYKPKKSKTKQNKNTKTNKKVGKYPHVWNDNTFIPECHTFDDSNSGVVDRDLYTDPCREIDCFSKMFPDEIFEFIVAETNSHHEFVVSSHAPSPKSRLQKWQPLTVRELKVFLAVSLLMVHNKKNVLENYWSTDKLQQNYIPNIMSRNRYCTILSMLHFSDNSQPNKYGKLTKVKELVDMFRKTFSKNFIPFRNVCIDESLLLFKGRLSFKQFIPSKRSRFGIKTYVLCDCESGYVLDLIVYTGQDSEIFNTENLGLSGAIVTTLLTPYLNKGHCLFVDNWYSSPDLFKFLHLNKTNACGTVRGDRIGMPEFQKDLTVGEREVLNNGTSMVVRWIDKRQVLMITSEHDDSIVDSGKLHYLTKEKIMKPKCIRDYNNSMGAVDRTDMMLSNVSSIRRTQKWYKKLFLHILDLSVLNSHAVYLCISGKKPTLSEFHIELVRQLIEVNMEPQTQSKKSGGRPSPGEPPLRLTQRHFPSYIPPTEKKEYPTRQCHVCRHSTRRERARRESRYMCEDCDIPLCVTPCFREYHTLKNF